MFIGILALAMVLGGIAATAALISGQSFLMALAIYSCVGTIGVFAVMLAIVISSAPQAPKHGVFRTNAAARN